MKNSLGIHLIDNSPIPLQDQESELTLDDLKSCLDLVRDAISENKESLDRLIKENQSRFDSYRDTLKSLNDEWKILKCELEDFGIKLGPKLLDTAEKHLSKFDASREKCKQELQFWKQNKQEILAREAEQRACLKSRALALMHDYERASVHVDDGKKGPTMIISRKAFGMAKLVDSIEELLIPEQSKMIIIESCIWLFLRLFYKAFADQINGLPHLAALFYNDCQYFAFRLSGRLSSCQVEKWYNLGAQAIQQQLEKQKTEINLMLEGDWDMEDVTPQDANYIQRCSDKAILKLTQLAKVWQPVLDKSICDEFLLELLVLLLDWAWTGLYNLSDVSKEASEFLAAWIKTTILPLREPRKLVWLENDSATIDPRFSEYFGKIGCYHMVLSMSLIQVASAYRKKKLSGLPPLELMHCIDALFAESPAKHALLQEIEADHVDGQEEEDQDEQEEEDQDEQEEEDQKDQEEEKDLEKEAAHSDIVDSGQEADDDVFNDKLSENEEIDDDGFDNYLIEADEIDADDGFDDRLSENDEIDNDDFDGELPFDDNNAI